MSRITIDYEDVSENARYVGEILSITAFMGATVHVNRAAD